MSVQHAVTFAAGLAAEGMVPVCAIYSSFLQRGYDQIVHDVALQKLPVRFALDRAGLVGADGATHSGFADVTYMGVLPNMVIMAVRALILILSKPYLILNLTLNPTPKTTPARRSVRCCLLLPGSPCACPGGRHHGARQQCDHACARRPLLALFCVILLQGDPCSPCWAAHWDGLEPDYFLIQRTPARLKAQALCAATSPATDFFRASSQVSVTPVQARGSRLTGACWCAPRCAAVE